MKERLGGGREDGGGRPRSAVGCGRFWMKVYDEDLFWRVRRFCPFSDKKKHDSSRSSDLVDIEEKHQFLYLGGSSFDLHESCVA